MMAMTKTYLKSRTMKKSKLQTSRARATRHPRSSRPHHSIANCATYRLTTALAFKTNPWLIHSNYNFSKIDTVHGHCEECEEDSIMVAIVTDYYRCTNCGADTRQHVNGSIRYLRLNETDKKWLKENRG